PTLNLGIKGWDIASIAAAGPAGAIGGNSVRIYFRPGLHVSDGAPNVFGLPFRHHPATLVAFTVAPTPIVEAETGVACRAELLEHHNVVFGVFEPEKARSLNDSGIRLALVGIRQVEHPGEPNPFVVNVYFLFSHTTSKDCSILSLR